MSRNYTRASILAEAVKIDIYDKEYVGRIWLYIFCGLLDAMWQTTAYWLMGAMSNDPAKLATALMRLHQEDRVEGPRARRVERRRARAS